MNNQALSAILRQDFLAFAEKAFGTVNQGTPFLPNWHLQAIAHQLKQCLDGDVRRLLITQPPRSLKSFLTTVAFTAWVLGRDPAQKIICVSYSSDLAEDFARQFRLIIKSAWYLALFPAMRVTKDTADEIVTTTGGGRYATSVGGTLTGRGADMIIIDDPLKAEDGQSETARKKLNKWYGNTLISRLNNKRDGVIILIQQRLHEDDLAGHVLESETWEHLDLPAIAIEDERVQIDADRVHLRKKGEALHEQREPLHVLKEIKQTLGSLTFSAQYQQRPVPIEGNLVLRKWFKTYDALPGSVAPPQIVQSWDLASSISATADYSACTTWAIVKDDYYLLDCWTGRLSFPDLKKKIIQMAGVHKARVVLIEDANPGNQMLQMLRREVYVAFPRPIGIKPVGDKYVRMEAQSSRIEAGQVYLPLEAEWLGDFLSQVLAFPNARHDDIADTLSQFLGWASKRAGGRGRIGLYGGEVIKMAGP